VTSTIFWDVSPCSPVEVPRRYFRGTYWPLSSGWKSKTSPKQEAWSELGEGTERVCISEALHGVTSHRITFSFISLEAASENVADHHNK
jgi:hypothetical protein